MYLIDSLEDLGVELWHAGSSFRKCNQNEWTWPTDIIEADELVILKLSWPFLGLLKSIVLGKPIDIFCENQFFLMEKKSLWWFREFLQAFELSWQINVKFKTSSDKAFDM